MTCEPDPPDPPAPRRRRRAVGPPGARPATGAHGWDALLGPEEDEAADGAQEEARLHADRPPHHDRGV